MEIKFKRDTSFRKQFFVPDSLYQVRLDGDFVVGEKRMAVITSTSKISRLVSFFSRLESSKGYDVMDRDILSLLFTYPTTIAVSYSYLLCYLLPVPTSIGQLATDKMRAILPRSKVFIPKAIASQRAKWGNLASPFKLPLLSGKLCSTVSALKFNRGLPSRVLIASKMRQARRIALPWWREASSRIHPFPLTRTATKPTNLIISSSKSCAAQLTYPIYHTFMVAQCRW